MSNAGVCLIPVYFFVVIVLLMMAATGSPSTCSDVVATTYSMRSNEVANFTACKAMSIEIPFDATNISLEWRNAVGYALSFTQASLPQNVTIVISNVTFDTTTQTLNPTADSPQVSASITLHGSLCVGIRISLTNVSVRDTNNVPLLMMGSARRMSSFVDCSIEVDTLTFGPLSVLSSGITSTGSSPPANMQGEIVPAILIFIGGIVQLYSNSSVDVRNVAVDAGKGGVQQMIPMSALVGISETVPVALMLTAYNVSFRFRNITLSCSVPALLRLNGYALYGSSISADGVYFGDPTASRFYRMCYKFNTTAMPFLPEAHAMIVVSRLFDNSTFAVTSLQSKFIGAFGIVSIITVANYSLVQIRSSVFGWTVVGRAGFSAALVRVLALQDNSQVDVDTLTVTADSLWNETSDPWVAPSYISLPLSDWGLSYLAELESTFHYDVISTVMIHFCLHSTFNAKNIDHKVYGVVWYHSFFVAASSYAVITILNFHSRFDVVLLAANVYTAGALYSSTLTLRNHSIDAFCDGNVTVWNSVFAGMANSSISVSEIEYHYQGFGGMAEATLPSVIVHGSAVNTSITLANLTRVFMSSYGGRRTFGAWLGQGEMNYSILILENVNITQRGSQSISNTILNFYYLTGGVLMIRNATIVLSCLQCEGTTLVTVSQRLGSVVDVRNVSTQFNAGGPSAWLTSVASVVCKPSFDSFVAVYSSSQRVQSGLAVVGFISGTSLINTTITVEAVATSGAQFAGSVSLVSTAVMRSGALTIVHCTMQSSGALAGALAMIAVMIDSTALLYDNNVSVATMLSYAVFAVAGWFINSEAVLEYIDAVVGAPQSTVVGQQLMDEELLQKVFPPDIRAMYELYATNVTISMSNILWKARCADDFFMFAGDCTLVSFFGAMTNTTVHIDNVSGGVTTGGAIDAGRTALILLCIKVPTMNISLPALNFSSTGVQPALSRPREIGGNSLFVRNVTLAVSLFPSLNDRLVVCVAMDNVLTISFPALAVSNLVIDAVSLVGGSKGAVVRLGTAVNATILCSAVSVSFTGVASATAFVIGTIERSVERSSTHIIVDSIVGFQNWAIHTKDVPVVVAYALDNNVNQNFTFSGSDFACWNFSLFAPVDKPRVTALVASGSPTEIVQSRMLFAAPHIGVSQNSYNDLAVVDSIGLGEAAVVCLDGSQLSVRTAWCDRREDSLVMRPYCSNHSQWGASDSVAIAIARQGQLSGSLLFPPIRLANVSCSGESGGTMGVLLIQHLSIVLRCEDLTDSSVVVSSYGALSLALLSDNRSEQVVLGNASSSNPTTANGMVMLSDVAATFAFSSSSVANWIQRGIPIHISLASVFIASGPGGQRGRVELAINRSSLAMNGLSSSRQVLGSILGVIPASTQRTFTAAATVLSYNDITVPSGGGEFKNMYSTAVVGGALGNMTSPRSSMPIVKCNTINARRPLVRSYPGSFLTQVAAYRCNSISHEATETMSCNGQGAAVTLSSNHFPLYDAYRFGAIAAVTIAGDDTVMFVQPMRVDSSLAMTSWGSARIVEFHNCSAHSSDNGTLPYCKSLTVKVECGPVVYLSRSYPIELLISKSLLSCPMGGYFSSPLVFDALVTPTPQPARDAAGGVAIGLSILSLQASSPTSGAAMARASLLFQLSVCAFSDSEPLARYDSPLRWSFGPSDGAFLRGAVVGNLALVSFSGLAAVTVAAAKLVYPNIKHTKHSLWTAVRLIEVDALLAKVHLPSMLLITLSWVLQATIGSCIALIYSQWDGAADVVLGVVGILIPVGCMGKLLYRLLKRLPDTCEAKHAPALKRDASVVERMTWPSTLWTQRKKKTLEDPYFKRKYFEAFTQYIEGRHWFIVWELGSCCMYGCLQGVRPENQVTCDRVSYAFLALSVAAAAVGVAMRPYSCKLDELAFQVNNVFTAVGGLLISLPDADGSLATAADSVAMTQVYISALMTGLWLLAKFQHGSLFGERRVSDELIVSMAQGEPTLYVPRRGSRRGVSHKSPSEMDHLSVMSDSSAANKAMSISPTVADNLRRLVETICSRTTTT